MMYGLRLQGGKTQRNIKWVDDCWYETSPFFTPMVDSCDRIDDALRNRLLSHYIYVVDIVDCNGNVCNTIDLNPKEVVVMARPEVKAKKANILSILGLL